MIGDSKTHNKYKYCKSFLKGITKHVLKTSTICSKKINERIIYIQLKMVEATQIEEEKIA
jgi:hypothetical protein